MKKIFILVLITFSLMLKSQVKPPQFYQDVLGELGNVGCVSYIKALSWYNIPYRTVDEDYWTIQFTFTNLLLNTYGQSRILDVFQGNEQNTTLADIIMSVFYLDDDSRREIAINMSDYINNSQCGVNYTLKLDQICRGWAIDIYNKSEIVEGNLIYFNIKENTAILDCGNKSVKVLLYSLNF